MATATQTQPKLTEAIKRIANELIVWMSEHGNANWRDAMQQVVGGPHNVAMVEAALAELGRDEAVVCLTMGTGALKAAYGGNGEDVQEAIVALKDSGKLLQFGRGRGNALILLDDTTFGVRGAPRKQTPTPNRPTPKRRTGKGEVTAAAPQLPKGAKPTPTPRERGVPNGGKTVAEMFDDLRDVVANMVEAYDARIRELETDAKTKADELKVANTATWS